MSTIVWMGFGNLALAAGLAVIAWLSGRVVRRPAVTHGLWVLVLLKLVTPPFGLVGVPAVPMLTLPPPSVAEVAEVPPTPSIAFQLDVAPVEDWRGDDLSAEPEIDIPVGPAVVLGQQPYAIEPAALVTDALDRASDSGWEANWLMIVGWLWVFSAFVVWSRMAVRSWRFDCLLGEAESASAEVRDRVERLSAELGVASPRVVFVTGLISPLLWVWGRTATLVLPTRLFEKLEPEQRELLLIHELAHWKRGDHWVRRLECLAGGLYWWCPLAWWATAELRQAEEECCDAWVVESTPEAARAYALTLMRTVDFLSGSEAVLPPLASGLGPFPSLKRRLTMIFRNGVPRRLTLLGIAGLAILGLTLLSWTPVPMSVSVASAQDGDRPRPKKEAPPKRDGEGREKEREKERDKDREERPDGEFGKLREELEARRAELERMRRELEEKSRQLEKMMERLRGGEGRPGEERKGPPRRGDGEIPKGPPRPDGERPFPPRKPDGPRPEGGPRDGGPRPEGKREGFGPDVDRRIDEMERRLEMMIRELGNLRKEMGGRGPGGPPRREGDGPPPPPPPPRKEGREGPPPPPPPRPRAEREFAPAPIAPRRVEAE